MIQKSVGDGPLLKEAARTGSVEFLVIVLEELRRRGLLQAVGCVGDGCSVGSAYLRQSLVVIQRLHRRGRGAEFYLEN